MANSPRPAPIRQKTICDSALVVALASSKITRVRKAHELRIFAFSRCQNSPEMSITTHDTGQQHSLNVCLPGAEKNLWNQTSEGHTSAGLPHEWRRAPFIIAHFRRTIVNPWEVPRCFTLFIPSLTSRNLKRKNSSRKGRTNSQSFSLRTLVALRLRELFAFFSKSSPWKRLNYALFMRLVMQV